MAEFDVPERHAPSAAAEMQCSAVAQPYILMRFDSAVMSEPPFLANFLRRSSSRLDFLSASFSARSAFSLACAATSLHLKRQRNQGQTVVWQARHSPTMF